MAIQRFLAGATIFLVTLIAQAAPAAEAGPSLAGTYKDETVSIELVNSQNPIDRAGYTGVIQLGERKFPLTARAENRQLKGTFESEGQNYTFSASLEGQLLVFTTGGTTYRLTSTRPGGNPLAPGVGKPNPLATAQSSGRPTAGGTIGPPIASREDPAGSELAASVAHEREAARSLADLPKEVLRLWRVSVIDDPRMIGGEAFSMLVPVDWQVEGGLNWRMHPTQPVFSAMRMSNPSRTEVVEAIPSIPFVWVEGGIPLFPVGSKYMGNEVSEPILDPIAYIKQIIIPRFRQTLPAAQIVHAEELPKIAEIILDLAQEKGFEKKFRAGRMRLEYKENGLTMHEDIYCVLGSVYVPSIRTTFWGPDRNYLFKAERGKLDQRAALFQAMVNSFEPNLQWQNRYVQMLQLLVNATLDYSHPPQELSQFVGQTTPEIAEAHRKGFDRQRNARERVNEAVRQYISGLGRFRNPLDGRDIDLPEDFPQAWGNAEGEILLAKDPRFIPGAFGGTWKRLERDAGSRQSSR